MSLSTRFFNSVAPDQLSHDARIWLDLRSGEKSALSYIYTKFFDGLYNYGSRITPDAGLTEDSIQDLFVELWNKREGLNDVHNVKAYLFKSLRRKIIYKLSIQARYPETDDLTNFEIELSDKTHYLNQEIANDI